MLVGSRRTGVRIAIVRGTLELSALLVGIVLGGTFGIGTLLFAFGVGPVIEASFWLLGRTPLVRPVPPLLKMGSSAEAGSVQAS
jgi:uncharacterized membrane protein YczE